MREFFYVAVKHISIKKSDVIKAFVIHGRKPTGLPSIMVQYWFLNSIIIRMSLDLASGLPQSSRFLAESLLRRNRKP